MNTGMKIKTEITRTILVVTCVNSRLDAAVAQPFFKTIQGFIIKGHTHIALDLGNVDFVDSTGLGAIVRCLKELGDQGQLVLYGVNEFLLSLLQLTKMEHIFTQAKGKSEAIELLLFNKKLFANKPSDGFSVKALSSLKMEDSVEIQKVSSKERRRHKRIKNRQITDQKTIAFCTNLKTGKRTEAIILDISPSGILLISPTEFTIGNEYLIEGGVGKVFTYKERVVIRQNSERKYGLEFLTPSSETTQFLQQLTGAVMMGKSTSYDQD